MRGALAACDDVLRGIAAADARTDGAERSLRDTAALSHLYASIARIQRQGGQTDLAAALETQRRALWQQWDRKLPDNPYVTVQLAAARAG